MFKRFTQIFLLGILCLTFNALRGQEDATIAPEDIRFWIGEGQNEVVFIVNWNEPDTALAWGYRFNENSIIVKEVMDGIVEADHRFGYQAQSGMVSDITFNDGYVNLSLSGRWWLYLVNGTMAPTGYEGQHVVNGDYIKWGDESCGTSVGSGYDVVWTAPVVAVFPLADDATIDPSEILYWVGEGQNEAIFIVNWESVAYAWGYRFNSDSLIVKDLMDGIAAVDERFSYTASGGFISDIVYCDGVDSLHLMGAYWWSLHNGTGAMSSFNQEKLVNGDYFKWGDMACAVDLGHWNYAWTMPVTPVSVYSSLPDNNIQLSLAPNPSNGETYLTLPDDASAQISVYDLQGRKVTAFVTESSRVRIETANWENGVYFVVVKSVSATWTEKLIVR